MHRWSLRRRLVLYVGLLMALVLAAFGTVLHATTAAATWSGIDETHRSQARAILGALEFDEEYLHVEPGTHEDPHLIGRGWELDLSASYQNHLAYVGFFTLFDAHGVRLHGLGSGMPERLDPGIGQTVAAPGNRGWLARDRGVFREIWVWETIDGRAMVAVVGRSVAAERAGLARQTGTTVGFGLVVLCVTLGGLWWITRQTVEPIAQAARSAAGVTAADLSARVDSRELPAEVVPLVAAFNATLNRLEAAFARQAQFTADASHELRTPVAIIRTQAEAALRKDRPAAEYRAALEACVRAGERMTNIVEGLLTLARADAGDAAVREPVALASIVRDAAAQLAATAAAGEVTLACDAAEATVTGDAGLLGEVVTNLVTNAVRYNRPGGRVDVALAPQNGHAVLRVSDTGIGIPADAVPHLFERFFRVDPARSRAAGGAGLGLAITRWIVEAHGGTIDVESTEGEGTAFTVRLPAHDA